MFGRIENDDNIDRKAPCMLGIEGPGFLSNALQLPLYNKKVYYQMRSRSDFPPRGSPRNRSWCKVLFGEQNLGPLHASLDDCPETVHIHSSRYPHPSLADHGFLDSDSAHLSPLLASIAVQTIRHNVNMPPFASTIVEFQRLILAHISQNYRDRNRIVQGRPAGEPEHIGIGGAEEDEQVVQHGPEGERSGFDLGVRPTLVSRGLAQ